MAEIIRQRYHLEPPRGLLNDPNGLCWFRGRYYAFFQWNRFEKNHSYKEWGVFTSKDLLRWEFEGSALIPDQEYEKDGVYSGSGYVIGDKLHLFYTGNNKTGGKRKSSQCLAVTEDGRRYQKKGVILNTPEAFTEHFRDPKVFPGKNSDYFMVVGAQQKNGKGALALCHSLDGETWKYRGISAASEQYEMIECPDLFELDGTSVLLYNPQKRDNAADEAKFSFSAYKLGTFDEDNGTFEDSNLDIGYEMMDAGFDFYAPQTFLSPDGRRILFGWMSRMEEEQEKIFAEAADNIHCMTLPRELSVHGKRLFQKPIRELYNLLGQAVNIACINGDRIAKPEKRTYFLHIDRTAKDSDISVLLNRGEAEIRYSSKEKSLTFSRKNWVNGSVESKSVSLDELNEIELWSDNSSMELFVNGGETVFSARIFPECSKPDIIVKGVNNDLEIRIHDIISSDNKGG